MQALVVVRLGYFLNRTHYPKGPPTEQSPERLKSTVQENHIELKTVLGASYLPPPPKWEIPDPKRTEGSPSVGYSKEIPRAQTMRANVIDRSPNDHLNKVHPGYLVQSTHTQHEGPPGPVDVIHTQYRSSHKVRMFCPLIVENAEQSLETLGEMLGLCQGHKDTLERDLAYCSLTTLISQNRLL